MRMGNESNRRLLFFKVKVEVDPSGRELLDLDHSNDDGHEDSGFERVTAQGVCSPGCSCARRSRSGIVVV